MVNEAYGSIDFFHKDRDKYKDKSRNIKNLNTSFTKLIKNKLEEYNYDSGMIDEMVSEIYREYYQHMIEKHELLKKYVDETNYREWIDDMVQKVHLASTLKELVIHILEKSKPKLKTEAEMFRNTINKVIERGNES